MKHPKNTAILNYKYHNEEGTKVNEKEWNVNAGLCTSGGIWNRMFFQNEAYEFVDILKEAGQKLWQILPLGQTGYGDSPYQSFSTFAGNPYFIDLETLIEDELLTKEECDQADFGENEEEIDYEKIYNARFKVLKLAYKRAKNERIDGK